MDPNKLEVFSVLDRVSGLYGAPVCAISDKIVMRSLISTLRSDPGCVYCQYPADYSLVRIGVFDVVHGVMEPAHDVLLTDFVGIVPEGGKLSGGETPPKPQSAAADVSSQSGAGEFSDIMVDTSNQEQ